jgi:hypothetical protein
VSLLSHAPSGRHFAQFHREPDLLLECVHTFLDAGLRSGNSVLIIAGRERADSVLARLTQSKFHPGSLRTSGQLAVLDAAQILDECVPGGLPDWAEFRSAIAPVLSRLPQYGRGIRVYSELANTLWEQGNPEAAVRLEEFWNAMAGAYQFALYCGFTMDTQAEQTYAGPLEALGRTHTDILGTPEDERFGEALDRASKEIFGIPLTSMAGVSTEDGAWRFPTGQRTMLWVKRNLSQSVGQLVERARQYLNDNGP